MIRVEELRFDYGAEAVLQGVDVHVEAGEVVALMGPSGSGKSTLLNCVAGLLGGWSGRIELAGRPIAGLSERELAAIRRRDFGYVLQFGRLVPELTAVENVGLPLRLLGTRRAEAERAALATMKRVGVAELASQSSGTLSGGQQQRVAVARALVHRPKIIFADEPTGALDSVNSANVLGFLMEQVRSLGTTVLMVTHDEDVARRADRVVHLLDGRIAGGRAVGS
ncbi:ABC transporter ATP-binding protein [Tessaracoccus caeni]|uniref:ABC transporter ATP-binding protein n=1 Tax=Tessaracoccus caeni TaxID=3031239 RepID=UPI0023DA764A|nr:ABC transporter ATP-binding protein [Tessaracoccus caeni]MDF1487630.1 ABC transporter ATP-binding protein [Tessaracoccus caeni]